MKHISSLDGLRGLAILMVLFHHYFQGVSSDWLNNLASSMWIGVDLFFVLSGFLITRILIKTKSNENYFRNFYIRRSLRIFPVYYTVIILTFFFLRDFEIFHIEDSLFPWSYILYYSNYVAVAEGGWKGGALLPTWSLAVEE